MLILDFDGTVTDAEKEGKPYREGYLEDLAKLTGLPLDEITTMAEGFEAEIAKNPDKHGWEINGETVAPATVDPYLRIKPVASKIFDQCGVFKDPVERFRLFDVLYKHNYEKTDTAFRDGADELLFSLENSEVYVVTNSKTETVQKKIGKLAECNGKSDGLDWLKKRVRGNAYKYIIDDSFNEVDKSVKLDGMSRGVLLRRRHYYDVINTLLTETNSKWEDLFVVGDIFELDLALPLCMGARVALVVNQHTPAYERNYVKGHDRGDIIENLTEILDILKR